MTETSQKVSPAVEEAKSRRKKAKRGDEIELSTGVRIKLTGVPPALLEDVVARVKEPKVPTWHNPDKDREEPNPNDPEYIKALNEVERERSVAILEAVVLFGMELVDGLPKDGAWLKKLRLMDKRGTFDLSGYDLEDDLDLEFLYKRYIALGMEDLAFVVSTVSGVDEEDIKKARDAFLDDQKRKADRSGPTD